MKPGSVRWFRFAVAAGFALGVLLLVDTVYTFRSIVRHLVFDHVAAEAGQVASRLETLARAENPADGPALASLAEHLIRERPEQAAWVRVADQGGRVIAASGASGAAPVPQATLEGIVGGRAQRMTAAGQGPRGEVLVVSLPFRYQFPDERAARAGQQGTGQPRFKIVEVSMYLAGSSGVFWPLRRVLAINLLAAVALLAAMTVLTLQFRRYVQARQVEQQLALARTVQHELLPQECDGCGALDFSVTFTPASEVGGDFYDLFRVSDRDVALVLGDVAGKGLPAAILMGVIHGAVRAASVGWTGKNHHDLAAHLNELLCGRTAENRYVTLFWGSVDVTGSVLRYVNAGHLPPLLFRRRAAGVEVERLDEGGPVLGLLHGATYRIGETVMAPGDMLVAFSDGLSEAANARDEEFGVDGVIEAVRPLVGRPPADVLGAVIASVRAFIGDEPLRDDLCVLVVRAGAAFGVARDQRQTGAAGVPHDERAFEAGA